MLHFQVVVSLSSNFYVLGVSGKCLTFVKQARIFFQNLGFHHFIRKSNLIRFSSEAWSSLSASTYLLQLFNFIFFRTFPLILMILQFSTDSRSSSIDSSDGKSDPNMRFLFSWWNREKLNTHHIGVARTAFDWAWPLTDTSVPWKESKLSLLWYEKCLNLFLVW